MRHLPIMMGLIDLPIESASHKTASDGKFGSMITFASNGIIFQEASLSDQ